MKSFTKREATNNGLYLLLFKTINRFKEVIPLVQNAILLLLTFNRSKS